MTKITESDFEGVTVIEPRPGPQTNFIASEADIAIYGGPTDCGKGWALAFMAGLHFEVAGYSGAIFRRRRISLDLPGSIVDASMEIFAATGATRVHGLDRRAGWPSGACVRFIAVEEDEDARDMGAARFAFVGFDELTEFTEFQFWKLASRARLDCGVRPHIRASVTADGASWVRELIAWWIGEDGFPIPERSGVLRWVARDGTGAKYWGDTREDVARRAHVDEHLVASVTFIAGEPVANPMHALLGQDEALRLRGNWNISSARAQGGIAGELPTGPGLWEFGDSVVRVVREADGSLAFDVATGTERLPVAEYRESPWGGRIEGGHFSTTLPAGATIGGGGSEKEVAAWKELERLIATGTRFEEAIAKAREAGARAAGARAAETVVESGRFSPSDFDSVEYLNTTPAGACRRVTETSGGESLTFEDDRRLSAASDAEASELAKLEALVAKMVEGNFGAGNFIIGGLKVIVADPRYMTAVSGGISVTTSQTSRAGGE